MKNIIFSIILSIALASCATVSDSTTSIISNPEDNAKFVQAVSSAQSILEFGGKMAISLALNDDEKKEYAKMLSGSGHVFDSIVANSIPSESEIKNMLVGYFPTTNANYVTYAQSASAAWGLILAQIKIYCPKATDNIYVSYVLYAAKALAKASYDVGDSFLE